MQKQEKKYVYTSSNNSFMRFSKSTFESPTCDSSHGVKSSGHKRVSALLDVWGLEDRQEGHLQQSKSKDVQIYCQKIKFVTDIQYMLLPLNYGTACRCIFNRPPL